MRAALLEWGKQLLHFAALLAIGLLLFHLVACAGMAHLLGVETAEETDAKVKAVHAALDVFGPWGGPRGLNRERAGTPSPCRATRRRVSASYWPDKGGPETVPPSSADP